MKLSISLDDELVTRADEFAKKHNISRSGLIAMSLNSYIFAEQNKGFIQSSFEGLATLIDKAVKNNEIDDGLLYKMQNKANTLADISKKYSV